MTSYEMRISDWTSDVCSSDLTSSFASGGNSRRCALILAEYIQREWMDTFNKGNFSAWTIRLFASATSPGLDRPHGRPQTIAPMAETGGPANTISRWPGASKHRAASTFCFSTTPRPCPTHSAEDWMQIGREHD